jgi:FkbM family methyltransferase
MSSKNSASGAKRWLAGFLLRSPAWLRSLRRAPILGRFVHGASRRILPADEKVWAQIEAGPASGIWLELNPRTGHDYLRGQTELSSQQAVAQALRPGMVFYDLGANLGLFSLLAARLVGEAGRVFSFEPDPQVAARLRSHIARNGFRNVVVVEAGVWSLSGEIEFSPADEGSPDRGTGRLMAGGSGAANATGRCMVRCVALDDFVNDAPPPDAIKCDVEGAEVEVLQGAEVLLRARHPWLLCETHSESTAHAARDLLTQIGYALQSLDANHVLALPANPVAGN